MKHTIFFLLSGFLLLTACSKAPANGDLDGRWHLMEIHSKLSADDSHYMQFQDKHQEDINWSFQLNLLSIRGGGMHNGFTSETLGRFTHSNGRLVISQTFIHFRNRDSLITDPNTMILASVGIRGNAANYNIEQLSSSKMTLCSEMDSLVFRKMR